MGWSHRRLTIRSSVRPGIDRALGLRLRAARLRRGKTMRLDETLRQTIKHEALAALGEGTRVRLFGSRVDDKARGGDIDLLVSPGKPLSDPVLAECRLAARLQVALGGGARWM